VEITKTVQRVVVAQEGGGREKEREKESEKPRGPFVELFFSLFFE